MSDGELTAQEIMEALRAPLPVNEIYWRVGAKNGDKTKGLALAYMDARGVANRLDEVFGIAGWMDSYEETPTNRVICTLTVLINGNWISKSDGAGATEMEGEKGAISAAFKRAASRFGVGRYLYYLPNVWVNIVPAGRSHRIANGCEPDLPKWAVPKEVKDD